MVETVIFDLGGTLIEYAGSYATWPDLETPGFLAAYDYLGQRGYRLPEFSQFQAAGFALLPVMWRAAIRHEQNLRVIDLLGATLKQVGVTAVTTADLSKAARKYGAAIQAQAWLMAQAVETLAQLKAAGYKVGLVSNTMFPGDLHTADLTRFGLIAHFDALVFSADVNKWKPNADPFRHVLELLGARAETAVYIGDDPASDVAGGRAAGMYTIYFKSNQRFSKPAGIEAHAEIEHLAELLPLLEKWQVGKWQVASGQVASGK
jgi:putative hydrolase of the HAD superfamily